MNSAKRARQFRSVASGIAIWFIAQAHPSWAVSAESAVISSTAPDTGLGNGIHPVHRVLRGVVEAVDERKGQITVRLSSDAIVDLRVRDGLLFDAVRYGDQVEITVEAIDGENTIVNLQQK
jgi:hypothetical protein